MLIQSKMRSHFVSDFVDSVDSKDMAISPKYARKNALPQTGCDELSVVRHYTRLSQKNIRFCF